MGLGSKAEELRDFQRSKKGSIVIGGIGLAVGPIPLQEIFPFATINIFVLKIRILDFPVLLDL